MKLCALHEKCSYRFRNCRGRQALWRSGVIKLKISQKNLIPLTVVVCHILPIKICNVFLRNSAFFPNYFLVNFFLPAAIHFHELTSAPLKLHYGVRLTKRITTCIEVRRTTSTLNRTNLRWKTCTTRFVCVQKEVFFLTEERRAFCVPSCNPLHNQ